MHRLPDVSHRTNHKGTYVAAHTFRLISPLETDSREFPTLARHATPENRMPERSTPSGNGRAFRLGDEPHGRLNRDRSGMSKPRQAISADLRLPLVRQLDGGEMPEEHTCSRSKRRNQISFRFGYLLQSLHSHLGYRKVPSKIFNSIPSSISVQRVAGLVELYFFRA
jgi:hypothetical protein